MFDPEKAQSMIIKLSDFLRFSLSIKPDDKITLKKEIENIKRYLDIEKVRFGNRLSMSFDIAESSFEILVPSLILQPLFENAIKYGVHDNTGETLIKASTIVTSNSMMFSISNNFDPEAIPQKGNGIGLNNIKERMFLLYNNQDLVKIDKTNNQFTVNIIFPL